MWTNLANAHMWQHYLGGPPGGRHGPGGTDVSVYAAPGRAQDLAALPRTYLMTAELDPLRDEGVEYARRLLDAGVPTELHNFTGACHGFDTIAPRTAIGRRALDEQIQALRSL
jgi:acetyl esterase